MRLNYLLIFPIFIVRILFSLTTYQALGQGMINNGATIIITDGANVIIDGNALGGYTNQTFAGSDGKIDLNGNMYVGETGSIMQLEIMFSSITLQHPGVRFT